MNYIIENKNLKVEISDVGAELQSIYGKSSNYEYLWQGNPEFWSGRAYNLFPICGRLEENKYIFEEKEYQMKIHGFAKNMIFDVVSHESQSIVFELKANEETLTVFPFDFCLRIKYKLINEKLRHEVQVKNMDNKNLYFSFGVHYGFNVPLCDDAKFDEHYIDFINEQNLFRESCAGNGFCSTIETPYKLEKNKYLKLSHDLFDNDSIFLSNIGSEVMLKCKKTSRFIKLCYKDMKHLVLWHTHKTKAPFICIEPWHGSPSNFGVVDDLKQKRDIVELPAENTYDTFIELAFNEDLTNL